MSSFLSLAYLFFIGSMSGWVLEVFFRKFFSGSNPEHKWINPGFCTGPYVPLYGCGLCALYLLGNSASHAGASGSVAGRIITVVIMAICMTLIEYAAGILLLKTAKVRLWDYSRRPGNINGLICPLFSLFWGLLGAAYYFLLHPHVLGAISWLADNLAFSFVIGFFFGVFVITAKIASRIGAFSASLAAAFSAVFSLRASLVLSSLAIASFANVLRSSSMFALITAS